MPTNQVPLNVTPLTNPSEYASPKRGRPSKLVMPPMPSDIMDAMAPLERLHFDFFVAGYTEAYQSKYDKAPTPTAQICIIQAGLDYINLLRMQAEQLRSGTIISQARQHPAVQLRAWLQTIGLQEKDTEEKKKKGGEEESKLLANLLGMSSN